VEVLRENLVPRLADRRVQRVEVLSGELFRYSTRDPSELEGLRIGPLCRRGRYLVLTFRRGPRMVVHLAPWAWIWHGSASYPPTRTTGVRVTLDDRNDLRVIVPGPQVRAAAWVTGSAGSMPQLRELGPDPVSSGFPREGFRERATGRRRMVKDLLTEPQTVPGVGDAYADEILFAAGVSPIRYLHTMTAEEVERLYEAIPTTLLWGISELRTRLAGGLFEREIRDFLRVHGRGGAPCTACGTKIAEIQFDDKKTNFCPRCQS